MKNWCCGFAFSQDGRKVILIRKKIPKWQEGKLNGIGGSIELGESGFDAMAREFAEEAGLVVPADHWRSVALLQSIQDDATAYFYYAILEDNFPDHEFAVSSDEGLVAVYDTWRVITLSPEKIMYNLKWLIPLALDRSMLNHYNVLFFRLKHVTEDSDYGLWDHYLV